MIAHINGVQHELPEEQDQATQYPPEYLPDLTAIAESASWVQHQAERLFNSGQRIVSDFRHQLDALVDEAHRMEVELQEQINQARITHEIRMARNAQMRANVEAMISYYTGHVPQGQPQHQLDAPQQNRQEQNRKPSALMRIIGGRR